jgi:hypothetical protein
MQSNSSGYISNVLACATLVLVVQMLIISVVAHKHCNLPPWAKQMLKNELLFCMYFLQRETLVVVAMIEDKYPKTMRRFQIPFNL